MMAHITWKNVADNLIYGNWGTEGKSSEERIKSVNDDRLILCLLIDIAQSLRILRCYDFKQIPTYLREIRKNTKKNRRKKK